MNTVFWGSPASWQPSKSILSLQRPEGKLGPILARSGKARSACIVIGREVSVPNLSAKQISEIEGEQPTHITRHFNKDAYTTSDERSLRDLTLSGSYHFGTISGYRPADNRLVGGRLGDVQEGLQRQVFKSRNGSYNADIDGMNLKDVKIVGFDDPVAIEYRVNDYCSCASIGKFSLERALTLRAKGNEDVNYYAVYDLSKLMTAIQEILLEDTSKRNFKILSRPVLYGQKDRVWDVEAGFQHREARDHLAVWLGTAFVKPSNYMHEEEIRLILLDPERAGNLPDNAGSVSWVDARIAAAIVEHGSF